MLAGESLDHEQVGFGLVLAHVSRDRASLNPKQHENSLLLRPPHLLVASSSVGEKWFIQFPVEDHELGEEGQFVTNTVWKSRRSQCAGRVLQFSCASLDCRLHACTSIVSITAVGWRHGVDVVSEGELVAMQRAPRRGRCRAGSVVLCLPAL